MQRFSADDNFNCGDTWPVGSFRLSEAETPGLIDEIIRQFDIPCWPELTGQGPGEELVGFWLKLYTEWQEGASLSIIDEGLSRRPGFSAIERQYTSQPLPLVKGQVIGPSTLMWALKKMEHPVIDRRQVLEFIHQSFLRQAYLLSKISYKVIISLDEPCAHLDSTVVYLWSEFFEKLQSENQVGLALHCCGRPSHDWLSLSWDVVHFDMSLLAKEMHQSKPEWSSAWKKYFSRGSWFAAGVVSSKTLDEQDSSVDNLESLEELFAGIGYERILMSTTCGLDARTMASLRAKLNVLTLSSQNFLSNRKHN